MVVSVNCTTEAWKCAASLSAPAFAADALKPSTSPLAASARAVAAPTSRRLSCHAAPGCAGEHRRGDRRQRRIRFRRQGLRSEDQIRCWRPDRGQVRVDLVPTPGRSWMTVPRYDGWLDDPSGSAAATMRDCRSQRAQRVELVAGEHDDALRLGRHIGLPGGVAHRPRRWAGIGRRGLRRARFVGPALIAQHAGVGDLGGAGDHATPARLLG